MDKRLLSIEEEYDPLKDDSLTKPKKDNDFFSKLNTPKGKLIVGIIVYALLIPLTILMGVMLFKDQKYNIISILIAVLACIPFFVCFERGKTKVRELVIIAVMTTLSVLGRVIFAPIPGFKPVTAMVIITAIACGPQAGFITGALSAVVSNIFYGQGPWTPFQMFAWGFLGLVAGIIFYKKEKPNIILLCIIGAIGGAIFSFIMDVWTVFSVDGVWNWERYATMLVSSAPWIGIYALSNVVFLLIISKPFLNKLNRIKTKYELFK